MRSTTMTVALPMFLSACVVAGVLGLAAETALANATVAAKAYPPNSLNYPPIGAGIDTIAQQPGGGYAIVLGSNCTAELKGCTTYTLPYDNPVQLLILDRTNLTPLFVATYAGSANDASNAAAQIKSLSATNPIVVVLAALWTNNGQIDSSWSSVVSMIVPEPQAPDYNSSLDANLGGWSAIGVPAGSGVSGPVGHVNTGSGDRYNAPHPIGDLAGYFQLEPGSSSWIFTTGGFAAFNTSSSQTAQSNTMRIDGIDYASGPLVGSNDAPCVGGGADGGPGGFQLVILNASTLDPLPPQFGTPANQTFATNCGAADTDAAGINALAAALYGALANQGGAAAGGAVVFLQSIGNPIVTTVFSTQQEQAARAISPLLEQLGGIADVFNKSWWFGSSTPGNRGYALVGSTALQGDAPSGAQVGVYGSEASSAAPGSQPPVLLEGLLKRNYLGRYAPAAAAPVAGAEAGFLPVTVYQPSQPWPQGGASSASIKGALTWFSNELGLAYDPASSCYQPTYPDVRFEYCDTNPKSGTWDILASRIQTLTYPGEAACGCNTTDWQNVQQQLATEMTWVNYVQNGLTTGGASLQDVLTDASNPAFIDLQAAANTVLDAVGLANSSEAVAGFWVTLASNALKFANNLVPQGARQVVGIFSTIGPLAENLASLDSSTTLGQIQATAKELPSQLSSRFTAATRQLGLFQSIIVSDYGKLQALGNSTIFQGNPFTDANLQAQILNGVKLFAYGRLLGAGYYAWGLLPDGYNPGYPGSPADYYCGNVGTDGAYPFTDGGPGSVDLTWVGFTYPNLLPSPLAVYGGNPNLLALASKRPNIFSVYSTVPTSVMKEVVAGSGQGPGTGLGEWDVSFFRQNFSQRGFRCSQLGSLRGPAVLRGRAARVGGSGDTAYVSIEATIHDAGPIDLGAARLVVRHVLMEAERAGEMVRTSGGSPFFPLELTAGQGSRPNLATFGTAPGTRPSVTAQAISRGPKGGWLTVSLSADQVALPFPARACEAGRTALLRTRFELDDGMHPPVIFDAEQPWTCDGSGVAVP